ncbi:MAG: hypothetical protein RMJ43_05925 [Chloroherpetonaceae bacterium]|nr:Holliday junction resolvase RuvX [Chthonomonadaceae bacterium]MDW8207355.1 hypothetical protein [Chloroherpetonaceae bacterium]
MDRERTLLPCVLAVDPGRSKCGLAVVRSDRCVLYRAVVTTGELIGTIQQVLREWHPTVLVVGGGTGSRAIVASAAQAFPDLPLALVDEQRTSEEARARFVAENPPRGWQRWIPGSLRTPDRPYDDYVAVILAEHYWQSAPVASPPEDCISDAFYRGREDTHS